MWNIVIGAVFIWGGLSGNLALRGTNSGGALAILGGVLVIWGIVQVVRSRMALRDSESHAAGDDATGEVAADNRN